MKMNVSHKQVPVKSDMLYGISGSLECGACGRILHRGDGYTEITLPAGNVIMKLCDENCSHDEEVAYQFGEISKALQARSKSGKGRRD